MNPVVLVLTQFHWPGRGRNHGCELRSRQYRPRPDNGSGDSPRPPFLTEFVNQIGKLTLVELVYHLFSGQLGLRVHPHVERSFRLKTESPRRVLQLQAAHAEISQQPVSRSCSEPLTDFCERAVQQPDLRRITLELWGGLRYAGFLGRLYFGLSGGD